KHRDTVSTQLDTKTPSPHIREVFLSRYLSLSVLSCLLHTVSPSLHMRHPLNRAQPLGLNCIQHLTQVSQDPTIMGVESNSLKGHHPFFGHGEEGENSPSHKSLIFHYIFLFN